MGFIGSILRVPAYGFFIAAAAVFYATTLLQPGADQRAAEIRFALDIGISGPDTKVHFDTDLGLEMRFSQEWLLRFGVTLGTSNALGFGIVF